MSDDQWPRVKALFHAALERPAEHRSAFLTDECRGDEPVRHAVERLLAAHAAAGSFIEASPVAGIVHTIPPLDSTLIGRVFGHYAIQRLVGIGGMGEVYAAHDTELGRMVALKVVAGSSQEAQARLRREAQHASRLNHPHICTIHHVGTFDDRAFIVMEFIEGRPLSELIGSDGLPVETMLGYGMQIADALEHAHTHGVIHRDLKSANVVVTHDGRAKVLDFGLARGISASDVAELSRADAVVSSERPFAGTLSSMAPELLRGAAADERSDIWALGVLLYEMAAGHRPFINGTAFEQSAAILNSPPPPLPVRVPSALQAIIGRCLAKDPHERYARASDVRSALAGMREDVRTGTYRLRSRAALLTFTGLLIVAAASVVIGRWVWPIRASTATPVPAATSEAPPIAVAYFENVAGAEDTAWLSKGVASMLLTTLAQTRGLRIISTQHLHQTVRATGFESLDSLKPEQMADVAKRAGAGAVVVGSIMKAGLELRIDARLEDLSSGRVLLAESVRGTDVFPLVDELAARIRDRIGFPHATDVRGVADLSSTSLEAYRLYSEGEQAFMNYRMDAAKDSLSRAVAIDPAFAQAYVRLASLSEFQDLPAARAAYLRDAAAHADRLSERERLVVEVEQSREVGDFSKAANALDRLIATYPAFENAYASVLLYEPLRGALYAPGKALAFLAAGVRALPTSGSLRNYYGYELLHVGRHAEAIQQFEAYARLAAREPNPYDSLGEAYLMIGVPQRAIDYYSQALSVDPTFVYSHNGRAWALATLGRYDDALAARGPGLAPTSSC
jgi:TolB-like protein/Tfp pilus assembly protein PilF